MSNSSQLYRLQEIDTTWDRVRRRLLQLQNMSEGSDELKSTREKVSATEAELTALMRTQIDAESETRSLSEKIQESEQLLMSGQVRNPKELESLQSSIDSMQRHKSSVEDRSVEALLKIEELNGSFAAQQEVLADLESDWQSKQQAIEEELLQRKKEFVYLKRLREQLVEQIDKSSLEQYEHLRRRKNGVAVAKLEGDVCNACHMQVPTGVVSDVRRTESLTYCTGCGRILHG